MRRLILILGLVLVCGPLWKTAAQSDLTRVYTASVQFKDTDSAHLANFLTALGQLHTFLNGVHFQQGVDYSFNADVLGGTLSRSLGYVNTDSGYGDGANMAASLLNSLVHQALFWDRDGLQKPVFVQIDGTTLKNDKVLGPYAVRITLNAGAKTEDYVWQLSPAYDGPLPRFNSVYDAETQTASLTVTYADEAEPPGDPHLNRELLTRNLKALIGDRHLGVDIIPLDHPENEIGVNQDMEVPSASAWKGLGIVYFFEKTSRDVWGSVPIRYWNLQNPLRVPTEYRDQWLKYQEVLHRAYVMTVFSGNHEAANILAYVYNNLPPEQRTNSNAIVAFNQWCRTILGINPQSGLYSWNYGDLEAQRPVDMSLLNRRLGYGSEDLSYSQLYTAHDLALAFYHLATVGRKRGYYDTAVQLLSVRTDIISKIEGVAPPQIHTATKDGYFGPQSPLSYGHDVNNDAGLLIFPDGRTYVVAFTAFDSVDQESDVVDLVIRALVADDQADAAD